MPRPKEYDVTGIDLKKKRAKDWYASMFGDETESNAQEEDYTPYTGFDEGESEFGPPIKYIVQETITLKLLCDQFSVEVDAVWKMNSYLFGIETQSGEPGDYVLEPEMELMLPGNAEGVPEVDVVHTETDNDQQSTIPIPFPNFNQNNQESVSVNATVINQSQGNEPGTVKGVVSSITISSNSEVTNSSEVQFEGSNVQVGGGLSNSQNPTTISEQNKVGASNSVFVPFATPLRGKVSTEWASFTETVETGSKEITKLRQGETLLILGESPEWYYAYDSQTKLKGYIRKEFVISSEQTGVAVTGENLEQWQAMNVWDLAKARGIAWSDIYRLFRLDKDNTKDKGGSYAFIRQKLLEGWVPEDGTPEIRTWFEGGMLVVDAWTPTLARLKVLEMGYIPDTGFVYRWNKSYFSKEKNETPYEKSRNTFGLRNIKNQLERDYESATTGPNAFEGDIYDFKREFGTYEKFQTQRDAEKMATFVDFPARGIAFDPPSELYPQGGVKLRGTPYGDAEVPPGSNVIGHLPFNTSFNILKHSEKHKWYQIQTDAGVIGYVADYMVRIPEDPNAKLHYITKGQSALEVVRLYYNGTNDMNYVLMLGQMNGAGIMHPDSNKKETWNEHYLLAGFLIWIPSELYAAKYIANNPEMYGDKDEQKEYVETLESIEVKRVGLTDTEDVGWKGIRDKVFKLPSNLIDEFNDITGISWGEFLRAAFLGLSAMIWDYASEKQALKDLDKKLAVYGCTVNDLALALVYFKKLALRKVFDLLDQSAVMLRLEVNNYKDTKTEPFQKLMKALNKSAAGYDEADRLRAKAVMRFFKNENTKQDPDWKDSEDGESYDNADAIGFKELRSVAGDETQLLEVLATMASARPLELLTKYYAEYAGVADYAAYSEDGPVHLSLSGASTYMRTNYPEFWQASEKETQVTNERVMTGQSGELPILADQDPENDWREIARLPDEEQIRVRVIKILNNKEASVKTTQANLAEDPERIWELEPVLLLTLREQNIPEDDSSNMKKLVWDRVADHDRLSTFRSIALAALGIVLAIAGIFSGGSAWVIGASIIGSAVVSGFDLYFEWKDYNFTKNAANTGIGPLLAVSNRTPSLIGVVFAVIGFVLDAVALVKGIFKVATVVSKLATKGAESAKIFDELYEVMMKGGMLDPKLLKADFIKQLDEILAKDAELFTKHSDALTKLFPANGMKFTDLPGTTQYALVRMYDVAPDVAEAMIKANGTQGIFIRFTVDVLTNPNAARHYADIAAPFMKPGKELMEEGVTVFRYLSESAPGTLDDCVPVIRAFEDTVAKTGNALDPKFMQEILTDQRLRKVITDKPGDVQTILGHFNEWIKTKSGSFADYLKNKGFNTEVKLVDLTQNVVVRTIDYSCTSGAKLIGNANKTTTLLGRWVQDMQYIKNLMSDADFNVGTAFGKVTENKGGFNFLNIAPDLEKAADKKFFEMYNQPWLDEAMKRGDDIVLTTKPNVISDLMNPVTKELYGNFAREMEYLVKFDYKPINLTMEEWINIKSWFQ